MKTALLVRIKNFLFPAPTHARHGLTHVCVCVALFCAWSIPPPDTVKISPPRLRVSESEMDAALQRAATLALGAREGTIIVTDAQTGRVRAAVNPRMAEEAAFPPGSVIKPFTLLAALRARAINQDARLSCRKHYNRHGADFTCSHPVYNPPFNSAQALAHSCNYYFARLAERLPHEAFNTTLAAYGLGAHDAATTTTLKSSVAFDATTTRKESLAATKTTAAAALTPRLPRGVWQVSTALGEGQELLVTPAQLIAAYAALFNGGHLYRTQTHAPENFRAQQIAELDITPEARALLLAGLRGAVKYGTASASALASLETQVFGKTGTATEFDSLHTHGWFVGFASERAPSGVGVADTHAHTQPEQPAPAEVKLGVLVFLKRGQGKQSAELAHTIFAEHVRLTTGSMAASASHESAPSRQNTKDSTENIAGDFRAAPQATKGAPLVRVRLSREEATRAVSLDDYLFGVLAAEASVEDEFAALKAQAVVSRTYALANLRRHARDGYDFCNTTHCQRFLQVTQENARPDFHELVRRAVHETSGEVLRDARGSLAAEVFFSTSCGGQTAHIGTLWGTPAREPYQRGVRDEYCAAMPHAHWTDAIPATQLARALREDERTDVGTRVDALTIVRRDATGRAEQIAIAGERRRVVVRGWDFKIVVGRTLGWSVLKSSRFDVRRAGDKFVFRGSGFGHGLGLCQNGAHVMAARGSSYRQILAYYFPATTIGGASTTETKRTAETKRAAETRNATQAQTHVRRAPPKFHERGAPSEFHESAAIENVSGRVASPARVALAGASFAHARAGQSQSKFAHAGVKVVAASPSSVQARLSLSSENFRVSYPARGASGVRRDVESVLAVLEAVRADVRGRLAAASLAMPALGVLEVTVHETTGDFTGTTGKPAWVGATTTARGVRRIELQPLATLRKRGVLAPTLRHEYAHAVILALSRSRAPLWLSEGLAAHVANEGARLTRFESRGKLSLSDLEKRLGQAPASAAEMRALYAAAFREVNALIRAEGEPNVWRRVARS
jgi:stage II sporulation protein D